MRNTTNITRLLGCDLVTGDTVLLLSGKSRTISRLGPWMLNPGQYGFDITDDVIARQTFFEDSNGQEQDGFFIAAFARLDVILAGDEIPEPPVVGSEG